MVQKKCSPPKTTTLMIKLARIGEFRDEYEEFFLLAFEDKVQKRGEAYARRWAYRHAAKTLFFAALEWSKLVLMIYLRLAGKTNTGGDGRRFSLIHLRICVDARRCLRRRRWT
jgi:hypothetical protein